MAKDEKWFWAACFRATWGKSRSPENAMEKNSNSAPHLKLKSCFGMRKSRPSYNMQGAGNGAAEGKNHKGNRS